jgi:hypothetical protein
MLQLPVIAKILPDSLILFIVITEVIVPLKYQFLKYPHGVTFQKTAFFIATVVKTSNLAKN